MPAVNDISAQEIAAAIKLVRREPGLRIEPGEKALMALYHAPNHTLSRAELDSLFANLDGHFGWFCRRVAELAGDDHPTNFALVDREGSGQRQGFTLKPNVVEAVKSILKRI